MNYLLETHYLQSCKLAFSLYKNWYDYNQVSTGTNVLPIYTEVLRDYERSPSKDWLTRYENFFIKYYNDMILPVADDDKIWLYKNIKPNEQRMTGKDIEAIAAITATEVRTWKFIIDNLSFYEKYLFTEKPFDTYIFEESVMSTFSKYDGLLWEKFNPDWFLLQNPTKIELLCTQPVFIYWFDLHLNKELLKNPTEWLPKIFTKHFNYSNIHREIEVLTQSVNRNDTKSKNFISFKQKIDNIKS